MLAGAVPGLGERMLEHGIRSQWADTVGPEVARRCRPGALEAGVLQVLADNSPWLHEMTLRSGELLSRVQARYGDRVRALRFSLGEVPRPRRDAGRPRPTPPVALTPEEQRDLETITRAVPDPAIASSLRRLMARDRLARRGHGNAVTSRRENQ
jgi:hypothetical protein